MRLSKCKVALLFLVQSCTPMEQEIGEEIMHEMAVAEEAIEKDLAERK